MELGREIAVYWDYENVPLPQWCTAAEAAKRIHNAVSKYGRIVERRVYFDYQKYNNGGGGPHDCSGLDLSGFDLVNTPTRNSKETLDKKLIADVLTFAWDCSARNANRKPCIVLLTSDGDYAYTLAKLRDRGVMSIVMFGKDCSVAQILVDNADVALSFEKDILMAPVDEPPKQQERANNSASDVSDSETATRTSDHNNEFRTVFFKNLPGLANVLDLVNFLEQRHKTLVQCAILIKPDPNSNWSLAHVKFTKSQDGARMIDVAKTKTLTFRGKVVVASIDTNFPSSTASLSREPTLFYDRNNMHKIVSQPGTSRPQQHQRNLSKSTSKSGSTTPQQQVAEPVTVIDITRFCVCLHNEQLYRVDCSSNNHSSEPEKSWVPCSPFNSVLREASSKINATLSKLALKNRNRAVFENAISCGYTTVARRRLDDTQAYVGVAWFKNHGIRDDLSTEIYLRLTAKGRLLAHKQFHKMDIDETNFRGTSSTLMPPNLPTDDTCENANSGFAYLRFANLPRSTIVEEFVEFIEISFHASVKRAIVTYHDEEVRSDHESQKCIEAIDAENSACVHLELANDYEGMRIVCKAVVNKNVFSEKRINLSVERDVASIMEVMAKGECYVNTGNTNISDSTASLSRDLAYEDIEDVTIIPEAGTFCVCLYNLLKAQGNTELMSIEQCWIPYSMMGPSFQSSAICRDLSKEDCKKLFKVMRDITVACDLVKVGRRNKVGQNKCFVSVQWFDNQGIREDLSNEFYVCLTAKGRLFVQTFLYNKKRRKISPSNTKKEKEAYLFLKNIPSATHVTDLVQYLESHLAVTVERAIIKPPIDASSDYCFAHVELSDAQDGARIIDESAILEFSGRDIHVVLDACIPPDGSITEKTSTQHYEKQELLGPAIAIDASQEEVMTKSEDVWYNNKGTGSVLSDESSPGLKEKDEVLHLLPATTNDSSHVADKTALDVIVPKEVTVSNYIGDDSINIFGCSNEVVAQIDAVQATDSLAVGGYPQLRELFERQISVLERQLEDVIASKDFQGAVLIQSNIDSLRQAPTVAITKSVVVMLNEELDEAIAKRDFSSAAIIQSYIENVEKYITSTAMKMVVIP